MGEFNMNIEVEVKLDPRWRELEDKYVKATEIAARHVETGAKQRAPVDTGATKNSINARPEATLGSVFGGVMSWRIGPTTEYAPFLEFGTVHMKAKPFMIPALESEAPKFKQAIQEINSQLT